MSARPMPIDALPPRLAYYLIEDLAEFGSKPGGFDFETFGILVDQARHLLRVAKGREGEPKP